MYLPTYQHIHICKTTYSKPTSPSSSLSPSPSPCPPTCALHPCIRDKVISSYFNLNYLSKWCVQAVAITSLHAVLPITRWSVEIGGCGVNSLILGAEICPFVDIRLHLRTLATYARLPACPPRFSCFQAQHPDYDQSLFHSCACNTDEMTATSTSTAVILICEAQSFKNKCQKIRKHDHHNAN